MRSLGDWLCASMVRLLRGESAQEGIVCSMRSIHRSTVGAMQKPYLWQRRQGRQHQANRVVVSRLTRGDTAVPWSRHGRVTVESRSCHSRVTANCVVVSGSASKAPPAKQPPGHVALTLLLRPPSSLLLRPLLHVHPRTFSASIIRRRS